jgi:hypothetical protein
VDASNRWGLRKRPRPCAPGWGSRVGRGYARGQHTRGRVGEHLGSLLRNRNARSLPPPVGAFSLCRHLRPSRRSCPPLRTPTGRMPVCWASAPRSSSLAEATQTALPCPNPGRRGFWSCLSMPAFFCVAFAASAHRRAGDLYLKRPDLHPNAGRRPHALNEPELAAQRLPDCASPSRSMLVCCNLTRRSRNQTGGAMMPAWASNY